MTLLMLGSGPAVGFAVLSHELGLAGHVARQLSLATNRAVSVQTITDAEMQAKDATAALGRTSLDSFGAVLTTFGGNDALCLTTDRSWRRSLRGFFDGLGDRPDSGLATFVLGIAPITALVDLPRLVRAMVEERIESLNLVSRKVCAEYPNATFVSFNPVAPDGMKLVDDATSVMYADWAQLVVPSLSRWLAPVA
ncbi:MAG: hypothetical protein ABL886_09650 [Rhodoglobus sp.]